MAGFLTGEHTEPALEKHASASNLAGAFAAAAHTGAPHRAPENGSLHLRARGDVENAASAAGLDLEPGLQASITQIYREHLEEVRLNYTAKGLMNDDPEALSDASLQPTSAMAARIGDMPAGGGKNEKKSRAFTYHLMLKSLAHQIAYLDEQIAQIDARIEEIEESLSAVDQVETLYKSGQLDPDNASHAALLKKAGISRAEIESNGQSAIDRKRTELNDEKDELRQRRDTLQEKREELADEYDRLKEKSNKLDADYIVLQTAMADNARAIQSTEQELLSIREEMDTLGDIETPESKERYAALVEKQIVVTERYEKQTAEHQDVVAKREKVEKTLEENHTQKVSTLDSMAMLQEKQTQTEEKLPEKGDDYQKSVEHRQSKQNVTKTPLAAKFAMAQSSPLEKDKPEGNASTLENEGVQSKGPVPT